MVGVGNGGGGAIGVGKVGENTVRYGEWLGRSERGRCSFLFCFPLERRQRLSKEK